MHRTKSVVRLMARGLLSAGLAAAGSVVCAQVPEAVPAGIPAAATPTANIKSETVVVGGTIRLRLSTGKPIRSVVNDKEGIARVQTVANDNTAVVVVGLSAGSTRVSLTDIDGKTEVFDIYVQLDVEAVNGAIRNLFPTASVKAIVAGTNVIVLSGNVAHPEDIESIVRIAQGVLGNVGAPAAAGGAQGTTIQVVNAMTVGGLKQVQLDVTIASVNRTEARRRNSSFIVGGNTVSTGSILPGLFATQGGQTDAAAAAGVGIIPSAIFTTSLPTSGTAGSNIAFGVVPANFNFLLQALKNEGLAKVLSEPKIVTTSGHPATFLSGGRQAVLSTSSGINGPGVTFEQVGTQVQCLPIVLNNGRVFLEVRPLVRAVNNGLGINTAFGFVPGFDEQGIETRVTLDPGHTLAIGGILQNTVQASNDKVPIVGELPYLGFFFSRVEYVEQEQELVVLVTPYLVDPMDCRQAPCKLPGMETRKPDDYEVYLETILEAPRGQRDVFVDKKYKAPYLNDPSATVYPCGGSRAGANGACGTGGGCATGNCASPAPAHAPIYVPHSAPVPPAVQAQGVPALAPVAAVEPAPLPADLPPEPQQP